MRASYVCNGVVLFVSSFFAANSRAVEAPDESIPRATLVGSYCQLSATTDRFKSKRAAIRAELKRRDGHVFDDKTVCKRGPKGEPSLGEAEQALCKAMHNRRIVDTTHALLKKEKNPPDLSASLAGLEAEIKTLELKGKDFVKRFGREPDLTGCDSLTTP